MKELHRLKRGLKIGFSRNGGAEGMLRIDFRPLAPAVSAIRGMDGSCRHHHGGRAATLSLETAPSCFAPRNFFLNHRR